MKEQEITEVQDKATIRLFALIGTIIMIIAWSGSWGELSPYRGDLLHTASPPHLATQVHW